MTLGGEKNSAEVEILFERYRKKISGALGELFGARILKDRFKIDESEGNSSLSFLNESEYFSANNNMESHSRPDGLIYRISGNRISIFSLLESKMGGQFNRAQQQRYIEKWKTEGMNVGKLHFSPSEIGFVVDDHEVTLLDSQVSPETLEKITTVVGLADHKIHKKKQYDVISFPLSREETRRFGFALLATSLGTNEKERLYSSSKYGTSREHLLPAC